LLQERKVGRVEIDKQLKVDEIVSTLVVPGRVRRGAGVQLLSDLVLDSQHRDRGRPGKAQAFEGLHDVDSQHWDRCCRRSDFVVSELEADGEPGLPAVGHLHVEWLHHVWPGHTIGLSRHESDDPAGKPTPACSQRRGQLSDELVDFLLGLARCIEVAGEAAAGLSGAELHRCPALDHSAGQQLGEDSVRYRSPQPQIVFGPGVGQVLDPLVERTDVRRVGDVPRAGQGVSPSS
jgi:hypothetical protein